MKGFKRKKSIPVSLWFELWLMSHAVGKALRRMWEWEPILCDSQVQPGAGRCGVLL